jgi:hypothetical protein
MSKWLPGSKPGAPTAKLGKQSEHPDEDEAKSTTAGLAATPPGRFARVSKDTFIMAPKGTKDNGAAPLLPQYLADLKKSGLSHETIPACEFRSITDSKELQAILRWKKYLGGLGAALCIPYQDAQGNLTGYNRLKPDSPRKSKDGKVVKYEAPKGASNQAYFPPGTHAALNDPACPLIITEGEKKAAKCYQEGFPCIGLPGVWSWQKKRARGPDGKPTGERELLDVLAAIPWQGRTVFLWLIGGLAKVTAHRAGDRLSIVRRGCSLVIRTPP